ncbi:probable glutathione S-transferase parA [Phalaenopsis equestris]|uniref:probable glutathione S-transferase parA n=1 Tax=Phalaenopsis equestris TaxID=78828 RepID=UPI0009E654D1|nr:probable glutathione S-transferase parA [Phalaenopsis equestris]
MAEEKGVKLLDFCSNPFGQQCRIALAEKGVEYECLELNLSDRSELLLKLNPVYKRTPALFHDGKTVRESLVIVEYIDEVWHGKSSILPSDPYERAKARFWADYVNQQFFECGTRLWRKKGKALQEAKEEFIQILKALEAELGDKKYFGGDAFGLVDIALVPFTSWFYSYETLAGFSVEQESSKLVAWAKRCLERESVAKSLHDPKSIYEFVEYLRKMYGVE